MCNGDNPQVQKSTNYRDVPNLFAARNAKMPAPNLKVNTDTARPRKIWRIEWSWNGDDAENRLLMFMVWLLYSRWRTITERGLLLNNNSGRSIYYYGGERQATILAIYYGQRHHDVLGACLVTCDAHLLTWHVTKKRVKGKRGKSSQMQKKYLLYRIDRARRRG